MVGTNFETSGAVTVAVYDDIVSGDLHRNDRICFLRVRYTSARLKSHERLHPVSYSMAAWRRELSQ